METVCHGEFVLLNTFNNCFCAGVGNGESAAIVEAPDSGSDNGSAFNKNNDSILY